MAFKLEPKQREKDTSLAESFGRPILQAVKGGSAALPGVFGDIAAAGNEYIAGPLNEAIRGEKAVPYEETPLGKALPTTAKHKKNLEEGIPYLKPRNKVEKFAEEVAEDTVALFIPGGGLRRAGLRGTPFLRSFATSIGANAGGEAVSQFSGDEKKGAYTKMGLMFLGSAINKPTANQEISNLYRQADQLLPVHATVNSTRLQQQMTGLRQRVLNGRQPQDLAPSETFVINEADTILRQIHNGESNVSTLRSSLRSLNENLQRAVYEAPDRASRTRARSLATQINRDVNGTLAEYGRTNPEWWRAHRNASQAFGAMAQSNFVTNFIQNNVQGNTLTHGLLHALGVSTGATGAIIPYQTAKLLYRITHSLELARHYSRILGSASAENASIMNKEIKELDEKIQKKESKNKKKFKLLD